MRKRILMIWLLLVNVGAGLGLAIAPAPVDIAAPPALTATVTAGQPEATATPEPGTAEIIPVANTAVPFAEGDVLTFSQFGQDEFLMEGPFARTGFSFGLPADWALQPGTRLELHLFVSFNALSPAGEQVTPNAGATLAIDYNGQTLATVVVNRPGEFHALVDIPEFAWQPNRPDGRHNINFDLNAALVCEFNQQLILAIRPTSRFILPHAKVPLVPDLTIFPRPFHQRSVLTDTVLIVVPDQPVAAELEAAMTVAAGLGTVTGNEVVLDLATAGQLTPEQLASQHLIFVGMPGGLRQLGELKLSIPPSGQRFLFPDEFDTDGLIQAAVSPWNPDYMTLVVSGNTETAVIKAARAVSTGVLRPGLDPSVARVSETQPRQVPVAQPVDRTLTDLGFDAASLEASGRRSGVTNIRIPFLVPLGHTAASDATFDLVYSHSALVDFERSGLLVSVNNRPVGSVAFKPETAVGINRVKFTVPPGSIVPGTNLMEISITLVPGSICAPPAGAGMWANVWPDSLLHLPLQQLPPDSRRLFDLSTYPLPFSMHPSLANTALVLARGDVVGWRAAVRVAASLGELASPGIVAMPVFYADALPEARSRPNLIVIGRASQLPLIAELESDLPAPFASGSDLATERNAQISYRVPEGTHIGYLEFLAAPWDKSYAILAVLGATDMGLENAARALYSGRLRSQLAGDLAIVSGERIASTDSRLPHSQAGLLATAVPGGQLEPGQMDLTAGPVFEPPPWILWAIAGSLALMVLTLAILAAQAMRQRRAQRSLK